MNTKLILIACLLCLAVVINADKAANTETEKNDHEIAAKEDDMEEEEEEEDSPLRELEDDEDQNREEEEIMDRLQESKAIVSSNNCNIEPKFVHSQLTYTCRLYTVVIFAFFDNQHSIIIYSNRNAVSLTN